MSSAGTAEPVKDELAWVRAIVDRPTDVVPDRRLDLPLVEESWRRTLQHERRVDRDRLPGVGIDVQQNLAGRDLPGGGGLSTRPRPLDDDSANSAQASPELTVYDPGLVVNGENVRIVAGRLQYF